MSNNLATESEDGMWFFEPDMIPAPDSMFKLAVFVIVVIAIAVCMVKR